MHCLRDSCRTERMSSLTDFSSGASLPGKVSFQEEMFQRMASPLGGNFSVVKKYAVGFLFCNY